MGKQYSSERRGEVTVVQVDGTLDALAGTHLTVTLEDLIRRGEKRLVLDFSGLTFMSSAGIRTVLTCTRSARSAGGDLSLASISEPIRRTLELGGVLMLVKHYPDAAAAVAAYKT